MIQRIAIDLDNTVADYMAGAAPKMRDIFGFRPQPDCKDCTAEELLGFPKKSPAQILDKWGSLGYEDLDIGEVRTKLYVEGRLFRDLPMIEPDTHQLTHKLRQSGYKIYIITARTPHPTIVSDTISWLNKYFFEYTDVFFTPDKGALCKALDIPIILEDDRHQIIRCLDRGVKVVARAQPWNEGIKSLPGQFVRADTWQDMLAAVLR